MNLVFGRETFDCFKQAERDCTVNGLELFTAGWQEGYTEGHAEGFKCGWMGISHPAPNTFTQEEWDEANTINDYLRAVDQMADLARRAILNGESIGMDVFPLDEAPPYDVSAECHDSQFEDDADHLASTCCCGCHDEPEPALAGRLFTDALGLDFGGYCTCGARVG